MRPHDRMRIELAAQRVGWWLDWKQMPGRRRREVLRELRAGLADAAAHGDLDAALERLGDARVMAGAYLEEETTGVRWRTGAVAAAVAFLLVTWMVFGFMFGFTEGVRAVGPEPGETYAAGTAVTVGDTPITSFQETGEGLEVTVALLTWLHLVALPLAFVVFARPWRALRTRFAGRARAEDEPATR